MKIALIPLKIDQRDPKKNLGRFQILLDQVMLLQPDLICLPECSLTGYLYDEADFLRFAEPVPGATIEKMSHLASKFGIYLCFGLHESTEHGVYNSSILLDRTGRIICHHRKLAEKPPFVNGSRVDSAETEFGKLGMLICGDLFAQNVVRWLDPALRLLLVPMARSFDGQSPDRPRWEEEERQVYLDAAKQAGVPTAIVNVLETGLTESSFGGALVVSAQGELLAESPHGTDEILIYDLE